MSETDQMLPSSIKKGLATKSSRKSLPVNHITKGDLWLKDRMELHSLYVANSVVSILHGVSSIALLTLATVLEFTSIPIVFTTNINRVQPEYINVGSLNVIYLCFVFELCASLRLGYTATIGHEVYVNALEKKTNPYRWIEYSISASCMTIAIATLSGIVDISLLITLFTLTVITMICGYLSDLISDPYLRQYVFVLGTMSFLINWFLIYLQFVYNAVQAPWFVYVINIGILLCEISFAIVQWYKINSVYTMKQAEWRFLILEVISKMYLAWIAFGGAVSL